MSTSLPRPLPLPPPASPHPRCSDVSSCERAFRTGVRTWLSLGLGDVGGFASAALFVVTDALATLSGRQNKLLHHVAVTAKTAVHGGRALYPLLLSHWLPLVPTCHPIKGEVEEGRAKRGRERVATSTLHRCLSPPANPGYCCSVSGSSFRPGSSSQACQVRT